jgi:spermidine/putrescine transport system permease protein
MKWALAAWTGLVLLFLYAPIAPVIAYSFNDSKLNVAWKGFTLRWYRAVWADHALMEAARNSLVIAAVVTVLSVLLGTAGAWALYRYRFPLLRVITSTVAAPLIIPEVIMGVSLLVFFALASQACNRWLANRGIGDEPLGLGFATVIIGHVTFCFPFVLLAVHARLVGMDPSIEEAALDLGATPFQALRRVIVPYLMPAIVSGALMAFTLSMDELIVTYFTAGPGSQTLPMKIFGMAKSGLSPLLNVVSTLFIVGTAAVVAAGAWTAERAAGASHPHRIHS